MMLVFTWICRSFVAAFSCLLFPVLSLAADIQQQPSLPSPASSILQMLLALGLVLVLIAGMAWLLRRLAPGQVGNSGDLRVVSAVAVGAKERVVLVDVGDTRLVLGVAQGQVVCLHQMPRPEDSGTIPHEMAMPPFVDKLREMISARKEPK